MTFTLREAIREIFRSGADYLGHRGSVGDLLIHKDELVPLIEVDDAMPVSEVISRFESRRGQGPDSSSLRVFWVELPSNRPGWEDLPPWWGVPLPLFSRGKGRLNQEAERVFGSLPSLVERLSQAVDSGEEVVSLSEDMVLMMRQLCDQIYLIEDVSCDSQSAREICRWASVGRSLVDRFRANGLDVRFHQADEVIDRPGEVIPCLWEGELMGYVSIPCPPMEGAPDPEISPKGSSRKGVRRSKVRSQD